MRLAATVLGASDPMALGEFYRRLLGWAIVDKHPEWVRLEPPSGGTGLSFQLERDQPRPVWPPVPGEQQMMMHLDIAVDDVEQGVAVAIEEGAALAEHQPQDEVRVLIDPAGHPFCLFRGSV
jgi:catechol 2,3-dioxygenase-like lactoylglutathione lyase family enzyme